MTGLIVVVVVVVIGLLLRQLDRLLAALGYRADDWAQPARTALPPATLLPRRRLSAPRLIGRRWHAASPSRPLAGLVAAPIAALLLLGLLSRDHREEQDHAPAAVASAHPRAVDASSAERSPGPIGVDMPETLPGSRPVQPLQIVLASDGSYPTRGWRRELRALGRWLMTHHDRRTRVRLIDARSRRVSRQLPAAALGGGLATRRVASLGRGLALTHATPPRRQRLLVTLTVDQLTTVDPQTATLRLLPRANAPHGAVALRAGDVARTSIDPRRPRAVAAAVARAAVIAAPACRTAR